MLSKRTGWRWLALLAVWMYAVAPVLGLPLPARVRACASGAAVHSCACAIHGTGPCCCKHPSSGDCGVERLPCGGEAPVAQGTLWTSGNPLARADQSVALLTFDRTEAQLPARSATLREAAPERLTPPPQRLG